MADDTPLLHQRKKKRKSQQIFDTAMANKDNVKAKIVWALKVLIN